MRPLTTITSPILVLDRAHIDTDQIIPARFLTTTTRDGLGAHAFADWRQHPPFDDPRAAGCAILVAGDNFGCGSSREHAPWALQAMGVQAVVAPSFADIFRANAHKNGLLTVQLTGDPHTALIRAPWSSVTIDVPRCTVHHGETTHAFALDPFDHHCLVHGVDELDYLLARTAAITHFEEARP